MNGTGPPGINGGGGKNGTGGKTFIGEPGDSIWRGGGDGAFISIGIRPSTLLTSFKKKNKNKYFWIDSILNYRAKKERKCITIM